jgi:hypothetical protein
MSLLLVWTVAEVGLEEIQFISSFGWRVQALKLFLGVKYGD